MGYFDTDNIRDSALFKGLTPEEFDNIFDRLMILKKSYTKKEVIMRQGDIVKNIGIIENGSVTGTKYHYDGSAQIIKMLGENDIVGIEAVHSTFLTSPCTLTADSYVTIVFFSYQDLFEPALLTDRCRDLLYQNVINILSDENIKMMYKMDVLSRRTLRERVTTYLSIIREKRGSDTFDIGMTQEQFAQYLCVNRSALSKELNAMRREKLIDFRKTVYTIKK